jgi:protein MpaA
VDLNRNLPTSNWSSVATNIRYQPGPEAASEKETKVFIDAVNTLKPKLIISMHSYSKTLLLFPANSVSEKYLQSVERLSQNLSLPVVQEMDYKIFGSLSKFGSENQIATLTVELPRGQEMSTVIATYLMPIWEFIHEII